MKLYVLCLTVLCVTGSCRGGSENEQKILQHTSGIRRKTYSSQQAIELLVSSWNDITTWPKRNESSSLCEQDVERIIVGYLNNEYWALKFFDSWGKPGLSLLDGRWTFVGNYRQCRGSKFEGKDKSVGFRGNYCAVTLYNMTHAAGSYLPMFLSLTRAILGICAPNSCSENDITKLFHERTVALNINSLYAVVATDCRSEDKEYTTFTKVAIAMVIIIGTLSVIGTAIDVPRKYQQMRTSSNQDQHYKKTDGDTKTTTKKTDISIKETPQLHTSDGFMKDLLLSFSVWTNWQKLMNTTPAPGSITAISGIRFLTMTWILFGHSLYFLTMYSANIVEGAYDLVQYRFQDFLSNMTIGTDGFFAISGFLVAYTWAKIFIDKGWKIDWIYFYVHRYWRLTPPYVAAIVLVQGFQGFLVSGAMAPTHQPMDKENCQNHWWLNALYINNVFKFKNPEMCFSHAWSMAVEMQSYIVSPLMLIPFYYHRFAGIVSCILFALVNFLLAGSSAYQGDWKIGRSFSDAWWEHYYIPFYTRIAPFAFGILAGYIMSVNGGRLKMKSYQVIVGWTLSLSLMVYLVFGFHGDFTEENLSSLLTCVLYFATSKGIWGACILWIIVACASGYGGPMNAILSWPPFIVLGRVTYMGYLIQMSVYTIIIENLEQPMYLNITSLLVLAASSLTFTIITAAVLTVFVEYPLLNLEKVFLGRKRN